MRLFFALLILFSCGDYGEETEYKPRPKPAPEPTPPEPDDPDKPEPEPVDNFALGVSAVNKACVTCHNGAVQNPSLKTEEDIKQHQDRICFRTGNGTMPPGGQISGADKEAILKGLGC